MRQTRITERDAIRTIKNANHPWATKWVKRMRIDGDGNGPRINRVGIDTGTPYAVGNVYTLPADIQESSVERLTGIRPSTWPEVAEKARLVRARVAARNEPMSPECQTMMAFSDSAIAFAERQTTADRAQLSLHLEEDPTTRPEDWPVHGVFVAMMFGSMFWMGAGVSSLIWWLAG